MELTDAMRHYLTATGKSEGQCQFILHGQGSWSRRTALLSRPDGSGEPSYVSNLLTGVIVGLNEVRSRSAETGARPGRAPLLDPSA